MSWPSNRQTSWEPAKTALMSANSPHSSTDPIGPVFLMIDSLETGGTERQFVELARSLRANHLPLHLGCLKRKGPFLDGLGELHEFPLGGSLYGLPSIWSRWRLKRCLQELSISVAQAFDFYSNLTLIPTAK